jgi:hypothetical protein
MQNYNLQQLVTSNKNLRKKKKKKKKKKKPCN